MKHLLLHLNYYISLLVVFFKKIGINWQVLLLILLFGMLIYWFGSRVFSNILQSKLKFLWTDLQITKQKLYRNYWREPTIIGLLLVIIYSILYGILPPEITNSISYRQLFKLCSIGMFTWLAVQIVRTVRDMIVNTTHRRYHTEREIQRVNTQLGMLTKIGIIIILVIGFALALMSFPAIWKLGVSILASAGITSVVLGLAAQKMLGNILVGVQVAFTQPIKIGDEIIIENEICTVEELNLTYVVARAIDKRQLIIPINYFIEKVFQNWTRNSSNLLAIVYFEVAQNCDVAKLRGYFEQILIGTKLWNQEVKDLKITNLKLETMEIRILASAANAIDVWNLQCYLREKLVEFLQGSRVSP